MMEEQLYAAMTALGLHVEPNLDTSTNEEYLVYGYDSEGTLYGDDAPCLDHRRWDLVYRAPIGTNRLEMRKKIRHTILDLFDVWPSEEDVSDASGQRYLYTFETIGGVVDGDTGLERGNPVSTI